MKKKLDRRKHIHFYSYTVYVCLIDSCYLESEKYFKVKNKRIQMAYNRIKMDLKTIVLFSSVVLLNFFVNIVDAQAGNEAYLLHTYIHSI